VPTARASRTIATPVDELWGLIRDPHHLPRWWPRVTRVEGVDERAFTEVMKTKKGKLVRADFDVVSVDEAQRVLVWSQRIEGTPFAQVLAAAETELRLAPARVPTAAGAASRAFGSASAGSSGAAPAANATATEVTIELRQTLVKRRMYHASATMGRRVGGHLVRRAAMTTIKEALDGLERIGG
jgi:uncharacterized protein YndB with AHSA1/START domain